MNTPPMGTPLIAQEIYLLERFSAPEPLKQVRDAYNAMMEAAYAALDEFMRHLPLDYRSRHLSMQPDIVWGERVLPNLEGARGGLYDAYERRVGGDWYAINVASGVRQNFRNMWRDYSCDWMPEPFLSTFDKECGIAGHIAGPIGTTAHNFWINGALSRNFREDTFGSLNPPKTWPIYRLNPDVQVNTGERAPRSGIYLPLAVESHPQVLFQGYLAPTANVGLSETGQQFRDRVATLWTLVERVADEGGEVPGEEAWRKSEEPLRDRCEANKPCPRAGYWYTYAKENSRAYFEQGTIMPNFPLSKYGATIWYWDESQTPAVK